MNGTVEGDGQSWLTSFEARLLRLAPDLARRLGEGIRLLELSCEKVHVLTYLARRFSNSVFIGIDFSQEAIDAARREVAQQGLENVTFRLQNLGDFDTRAEPESYDAITAFCGFYDQARPLNVLSGIHRALRSDGVYIMQGIRGSREVHENVVQACGTPPHNVSCIQDMMVSSALNGAALSTMWGEQKTRDFLWHAGFRSIETYKMPEDITNNWYVVRK